MTSRIIVVFTVLVPLVLCWTDVRQQTTAPTQCHDLMSTCDLLDPTYYCVGEYYSWAWENCKKTCDLCDSPAPTTVDPDTTKPPGCHFEGQLYNQNDSWISKDQYRNCTCIDADVGYYKCRDLPCESPGCLGYGPEHGFLLPGGTDFVVCVYKGQRYIQDQSWDDGCIQTCTCTNATKGLYSCRAVCLNWTNLPSICHMDDAPPGLCCQQPKCPSSIVINIPLSYKSKYPGYNYV